MPLASLFNLQYYGSASASMVGELPIIESELTISGLASANIDVVITNLTPNLKLTRLVNSPVEFTGLGELHQAIPKGRAKALLDISIGANPSAFDIAQAVWNSNASALNIIGTMGELLNGAGSAGNPWISNIEGTYTAGDILKLMVSVLVGKTSISGSTVTFRDINDTKDRVVAEMTNSERTTVTKDIS
jgi:hypothetical protein